MSKTTFHSNEAPEAIGAYSQAVAHGDLVFLSGQIPLKPGTMELVSGAFADEVGQVIDNIEAVCRAAGRGLDDILRLTVYLTDMGQFPVVNEVMASRFTPPFPARAAIGVASLPKGARVEMDAILAR